MGSSFGKPFLATSRHPGLPSPTLTSLGTLWPSFCHWTTGVSVAVLSISSRPSALVEEKAQNAVSSRKAEPGLPCLGAEDRGCRQLRLAALLSEPHSTSGMVISMDFRGCKMDLHTGGAQK